jgi:uncharacterized membrane protein YqhA
MNPNEFYQDRLEHFTRQARAIQSKLKRLSFLRLGIFLATLVLVYFAVRWGVYAVVLVAVAGLAAFLFTVIRYIHLQRLFQSYENLATINNRELKALKGDFSVFDPGYDFADPDHPYSSDLDIFGDQGLFQYLNRSATGQGRQRLASWLMEPLLDAGHIRERQGGVEEMAGKPELRQEFMATGFRLREMPSDRDDLLSWVNEPAEFSHWKFRLMVALVTFSSVAMLALVIASAVSPVWLLLYLMVPFGLLGLYLQMINRIYRKLSRKSDLVKKYSGLLSLLEREKFTSGQMASLVKNLSGRHGKPSEATRHLSAILDAFENRNNMLMGFFLNFLCLWDIIQVIRTERWQALHREELAQWLEVLAETDAICSLANFRFNHPLSVFPAISDESSLVKAEALGHPLIPEKNRVDNPLLVPGWQHFIIITGANMAGKSTYLRTVGVNLVLAMAGSAVIAREMTFCPALLITSIRTRDSLQKNESYFYAELKRLKLIIDWLAAGEKLMILLDEILKGTNSRDKQSGSIALLEKLLRYQASGLIATHDLALGDMEKTSPENITNKSFEVVIENDLLVFDYKLKDGIARQMNATFLMKKMGITD